MKKNIMLTPSYMKKFSCIGGECDDTCCAGWNVSVDKKSYLKYRSCKNKELRVKLEKHVKRNRKSNEDSSYGKIKLDFNSRCPFLNEENLCNIYIFLGEEALSTVCTTYPRIYNIVDGVLEKSLTVSCPEAAKLILDNEEYMSFDEIEYENEISSVLMNIRTDKREINKYLERYFWDLRIMAINIIQNRKYSLDDRIIILGLLSNEVNIEIKSGQGNDIHKIIEKYKTRIEESLYKAYIESIPSKINIKLLLISKMEEVKLNDNEKFMEIVQEGLKGIGYLDNIEVSKLEKSYLSAYENYKSKFGDKYEYILENYLVNNLFKGTFPLTEKNDIFYEYVRIAIYYSIIKFNNIGLANNNNEFDKKKIIKFIQLFSKVIEHDTCYFNIIQEALKEQNLYNMACMAVLIKN